MDYPCSCSGFVKLLAMKNQQQLSKREREKNTRAIIQGEEYMRESAGHIVGTQKMCDF